MHHHLNQTLYESQQNNMDSIIPIQLLESVALYQSCVMLYANSLAYIAVSSRNSQEATEALHD